MQFSYDIRGDKAFKQKFARFRMLASLRKIVSTVTLRVLSHMRTSVIRHGRGAPVWGRLTQRHGKSGLLGSIQARIERIGRGYLGRIGSRGQMGRILKAHEYGMTIRPKRAKVLHFFTFEGEEVFARKVRLSSRPTFGTTTRQMRPKVPGIISRMLAKTQHEVGL